MTAPSNPYGGRNPETLSTRVIKLALDVHWELGPGLPVTTYRECLCYELSRHVIYYESGKQIPIRYKNMSLDCGFQADLIINGALLLELKSIEKLMPVHEAQMMAKLKLSGFLQGLLINFNTRYLSTGIRRIELDGC